MAETTKTKSTSVTTRISSETKKSKVPDGAEIVNSNITTQTEEIENGWLITKNYDVTYRVKGSEHNDYAYFNKKWFSKKDPLTVKLNDKALAEEFEDENNDDE